jgi:hypothetical protein
MLGQNADAHPQRDAVRLLNFKQLNHRALHLRRFGLELVYHRELRETARIATVTMPSKNAKSFRHNSSNTALADSGHSSAFTDTTDLTGATISCLGRAE